MCQRPLACRPPAGPTGLCGPPPGAAPPALARVAVGGRGRGGWGAAGTGAQDGVRLLTGPTASRAPWEKKKQHLSEILNADKFITGI